MDAATSLFVFRDVEKEKGEALHSLCAGTSARRAIESLSRRASLFYSLSLVYPDLSHARAKSYSEEIYGSAGF